MIEGKDDLRALFFKGLSVALSKRDVHLSEYAQIYIIDLLEKSVSTKKLFFTKNETEVDEPLALLYGRAISSNSLIEQIDLFRLIGDRSLYVSGFFPDSFHRKNYSINYYMDMGEKAYDQLSSLLESRKGNLKDQSVVFDELSNKFKELVDLIAQMSESFAMTSSQDLLKLYERWLNTKSQYVYEKLKESGVLAIDQDKDVIH